VGLHIEQYVRTAVLAYFKDRRKIEMVSHSDKSRLQPVLAFVECRSALRHDQSQTGIKQVLLAAKLD
jgi:hypothetical protein